MTECNFVKLVRFLDRKLNLDGRLEILYHLDQCDICREAIYSIRRDRDEAFFVYRPCPVAKRTTGLCGCRYSYH